MSKPNAWMPLYVGDYLRDTGHLTGTEHGAYLLLLMQAWTRGGSLPADDERLRLMAKLDRKEWSKARGAVLAFFVRSGDEMRNPRLDREISRARSTSEERSRAGASGAQKRWKKADERIANAMANGMANAMATPSQNDAQSQSQSHPHTREDTPKPPPQSGGGLDLFSQLEGEKPAPRRRAAKAEARSQRAAIAGESFERFWAAYPQDRLVGADAAARAFRKAVDGGVGPEEIIAGARRYAAHCQAKQTATEYIAHPTTWLNQGRWKDVLPEPIDTSPEAMKRMSIVRRALTDEARFPEGGPWQLRAAVALRLIRGFVVGDQAAPEVLAEVEAIKRDLDRAVRAGVEVVDYRPPVVSAQAHMAPRASIPALTAAIAGGRS